MRLSSVLIAIVLLSASAAASAEVRKALPPTCPLRRMTRARRRPLDVINMSKAGLTTASSSTS